MPCCCCAWLSKRFKPDNSKVTSPENGVRRSDRPSKESEEDSVLLKLTEETEDREDYYGGPNNGNPRNKCALQPGHSLMDWIRLGNSGKDLTGFEGRTRGVTFKELANHSKRDDAWLALKGNVYNITHYLNYHPGGVDELMRGAGKDATKLFDQVHPWVNYESLLSKCLIGPLKQEQVSAEEFSKLLFGNQTKSTDKLQEPPRVQDLMRKSMENLAYCITPARKKATNVIKSTSSNQLNTNKSNSDNTLNISTSNKKDQKMSKSSKIIQTLVNSSDLSLSIMQQSSSSSVKSLALNKSPERQKLINEIPKVIITEANSSSSLDLSSSTISQSDLPKSPTHQLPNLPKFDWIQKSTSLCLIFYTKQLCNPHIYVNDLSQSKPVVSICFIYNGYKYSFVFNLENFVKWPCEVIVSHESGKIEINLLKTIPKIWQSFGLIEKTSIERAPPYSEEDSMKYRIVDTWKITSNTYLIMLTSLVREYVSVPIGHHLKIFCFKAGNFVRSYTPTPPHLTIENKPIHFTSECLCLMVKRYQSGVVSSWLTDLTVGDVVTVSKPLGSMDLTKLQNTVRLYLVAAGTGLTPMLSLILFSLSRRNPKCQLVSLLFFNRTQDDILWDDQLEKLSSQDKRFSVTNILSEPKESWKGGSGHIDRDIILRHFASTEEESNVSISLSSDYFYCVCGPNPFVHTAEQLLLSLGFQSELMYLFSG